MTDDSYAEALVDLVAFLRTRFYRFVTPTPTTHAHVVSRVAGRHARDLRDVFGWSLPFGPDLLDDALLARLMAVGAVEKAGNGYRSRLRVSSLGDLLFVHSAYPTDDRHAVFFGPDSYRFAMLIERQLGSRPARAGARLLDIGTGAGVGAIVAAHLCPGLQVAMTDVNAAALRLAHINARVAGVPVTLHLSDDLSAVEGEFDVMLANPPYIIDEAGRAYRDGGGMHGGAVSLQMAQQALARLAPGGRFILYTGSAIVGGADALHDSLASLARDGGCTLDYAEIDPDVFGEEMERNAYRDVERIALVSAVIERPEGPR